MVQTERLGITSTGRPLREITQWIQVSDTDPRGQALPGHEGRWIVAAIAHPLGAVGAEPVDQGRYDTAVQAAENRRRTQATQLAIAQAAQQQADRTELLERGVPLELIVRLLGPPPSVPEVP